jgi:hypothetical protein
MFRQTRRAFEENTRMYQRLWKDEAGAVISAELVLVMTIVTLGVTVGLVSVRDQVVQELADLGAAVARVNQSYSISAVSGHHGSSAGSVFIDTLDSCQGVFGDDLPGEAALCIGMAEFPTPEG